MKLRLTLTIIILALLTSCSKPQWQASENPDPAEILSEARSDVKNKNYEVALLKYIWINEHSLEHRFSFIGVRNSYALDEWYEMGQKYPQALEKFHEYRNNAKQKVKNKDNMIMNFGDFQSFNQYSDKQQETIDLFSWIEINAPFIADKIYIYAKKDLYKFNEYKTLNKYIKPLFEFNHAAMLLKSHNEESNHSDEMMFSNEVVYIITVLIKNNRIDETKDIITKASQVITDPSFKESLETILSEIIEEQSP